ncbi:mannose-6-phosphate isomerase-like protein (cupin superfamily) [Catenuloplanes nepalensis]|uniref:Mannose-6-phosphate isomerase-like protein (Cupin superfamily) n=1 Tax=Catenuloplanes nepalensis TaxID=587533 RepID=A0ABT9MR70_9ACTN|nr:cupin domain-containing protein [Catenuloplanes nepalensis]MDP9793928.1 mannose-6-phosphate isomerase-like protein (cupin superfamily) [Catenuloplanes nepalensis]
MHDRTPTGLERVIANPVMGVEVTFLKAVDDPGGDQVESLVRIPAGEIGPPPHYHLDFEERFTAVEGTLHMDLGDQRGLRLEPGESVLVPRTVRHRYYNAGDRDAVFRFEATPGAAYERATRAAFGLARDGRTDHRGVPRELLDKALMFDLAGSFAEGPPLWLQKILTRAGVRVAVALGRDPGFRRYTEASPHAPDRRPAT